MTAQPDGIFKNPADFWGALDQSLKASIDYRLTVTMELGQEITSKLVLTKRLEVVERGKDRPKEELALQIGGRVHEQSEPTSGLAGVEVTLLERSLDTVTDDEGRFGFSRVPPGKYTLVITAPGQRERRREIQVPSDDYDIGL